MKYSEYEIIKAIHHYIAKNYIAGKEIMMDDLLAAIAVCYFPFIKPKTEYELIAPPEQNSTNLDKFKEYLSNFLKQQNSWIDDLVMLSRDGLYDYFYYHWITTLSQSKKQKCCEKILLLALQGDKLSYNKVEAVYKTYSDDKWGAGVPDSLYGKGDYDSNTFSNVESSNTIETVNRSNRQTKEKKIEELWTRLSSIACIKGIMNRLLNKDVDYVWQLKICYADWKKIKTTCEGPEVIDLINTWGGNGSYNKYDKEIAIILLIYVGEWYKREWNGNDGDKLGDIVKSNTAEKIVITLRKYRPEFPCVEYKDQRHNRWLDALKVQGGFPLWYIYNHRTDANNPYFSMFRSLLKNSEQELDWDNQVPRTVESNSTYRLSNEKNDSIAQYSWTILEQQYPYDVNDFIYKENGVKFEVLGEILRNLANSKFRYSWQVGKIGASAYVRLQISFRDERDLVSSSDERKYAIQEKRLRYWLNKDQGELPESFFISFNQPKTKKVLKTIYFDCCTDGSWIPRASYQYRYQLPFENEKKISVSINGFEFSDNLHNDDEKGYQLMYSADNVYWMSNSLSLKKAFFACLIFDVDKYADTPGLERIDGGYGWVRSADNHIILLTDETGKEIRIFNNKDKLIVSSIDANDSDNCTTCLKNMDYVVNRENYVLVLPSSSNLAEESDDVEESTTIMIPYTHIIQPNTQLYFYQYNEKSRSEIREKERIKIKEGEQEYELGNLPIGYHAFTFYYEGKEVTDNYFVLPADFSVKKTANNQLAIDGLSDSVFVCVSGQNAPIINRNKQIQFSITEHKELYYTLCLTINGYQLQIPIIPPYTENIYVPQDSNRVIPLPYFYNSRKYEKKSVCEKSAEQDGLTTKAFLKKINLQEENVFHQILEQNDAYYVTKEVVECREEYRFYYYDGTQRLLSISDNAELVLDGEKSWSRKHGVIIQSYAEKMLKPAYFFYAKKLNGYLNVTARRCLNDFLCRENFDRKVKDWRLLVLQYQDPTIKDEGNLVKTLLSELGLGSEKTESSLHRLCDIIEMYDFQYDQNKKDWSQEYLDALLFALEHRIQFDLVLGKEFVREGNNWRKDFLQQVLCKYFNYCDTNNVKIVYQGLWRLANEYEFDWIWLWSAMKDDVRYIQLLEERIPEPWTAKCKMKALLLQLLRVNNYNSRRQIKQSIKDMLKLMYRPNECYKNGCYQLGEAYDAFDNFDETIRAIYSVISENS